ncbi:MAG: L-rhamnose mutarotase [Terracidiphilus sp.]
MNNQIQRYASVVGVRDSKVAQYRELHKAVWPEVLAVIKSSRICNYSIYLRKLVDGRYYLFSYFEYVGTDFSGDMARMIEHPVTKRWWAESVPCLELLPDRALGEVWSPMTEVFHVD